MRKLFPWIVILVVGVLGLLAGGAFLKLRSGNLLLSSPESQLRSQRKTANTHVEKVLAQLEKGIAYVNQTSDAKSGQNPEQAITSAVEQFQAAQKTLGESSLPEEYSNLRVKLNQTLAQLISGSQKLRDGAKAQNGKLLNQGTEEFSTAVTALDELRALRDQLR
jgi:hypothetical protein